MAKSSPTHKPDDKTRRQIEILAGVCGMPHRMIARVFDISLNTLKKYYKVELKHGKISTNSRVVMSLFNQCMKGNVTAQIFWLKTQAGWKETGGLEHSFKGFPKVIFGEYGSPGFEAIPTDTGDNGVTTT